MVLLVDHIQIIQNTFSADHLNTDTFTEFFHGKELHHSDLSGMCHMSSAAGTDIHPWKFYDPHLTGKLFFASVVDFFQFLRCRIYDLYLRIFPYLLVCFPLDLGKLHLIQRAIQIYGNGIAPHMKAYIIISVSLMDQSAHHVLTGMLLHQIKPSYPVNASLYFCSGFHRLICIMEKFSLLFMHFLYFHIVEISGIAWLSAALRVKSTLIQNDMKAFFGFSALQDFGCKFFFIYIFII